MANLQSRQHGWLGVRGRTSLTLQIFIALLFSLSCQVNRVKKSSFEAAVKKIYPKQSPSNVPKVDGSKLTVHSVDVKKHRIKTQDMNAIDVKVDADEDSDYQRLVVCKDGSATECSPALSSPELFDIERVQRQVPYGLVIVQVQTCVFPKNAIDPKRNCGPWKQVHFRNESCAGETCPELPPDPADVYKLLCAEIEKALKDYQGAPIDEVPADIMARAERSVEEQLQIPISNFVNINHPMNCPLVIERHKELANKNMLGAAFLIGLGLTTAIVGGMLIYKGRPRSVATEIMEKELHPEKETAPVKAIVSAANGSNSAGEYPGTYQGKPFDVIGAERKLKDAEDKRRGLEEKEKGLNPGSEPGKQVDTKKVEEQIQKLNRKLTQLGKAPTTQKTSLVPNAELARLRKEKEDLEAAYEASRKRPLGPVDPKITLGNLTKKTLNIRDLEDKIQLLQDELARMNLPEKERELARLKARILELQKKSAAIVNPPPGLPPLDSTGSLVDILKKRLEFLLAIVADPIIRTATIGQNTDDADLDHFISMLKTKIGDLKAELDSANSEDVGATLNTKLAELKLFFEQLTTYTEATKVINTVEIKTITFQELNAEGFFVERTVQSTGPTKAEYIKTLDKLRSAKRFMQQVQKGEHNNKLLGFTRRHQNSLQKLIKADGTCCVGLFSQIDKAATARQIAVFYAGLFSVYAQSFEYEKERQIADKVSLERERAAYETRLRTFNELNAEKEGIAKKIAAEQLKLVQLEEKLGILRLREQEIKTKITEHEGEIRTRREQVRLANEAFSRQEIKNARQKILQEKYIETLKQHRERLGGLQKAEIEAKVAFDNAVQALLAAEQSESQRQRDHAQREQGKQLEHKKALNEYDQAKQRIENEIEELNARKIMMEAFNGPLATEQAASNRGKLDVAKQRQDLAREIAAQEGVIDRLREELVKEQAKERTYNTEEAAHNARVIAYKEELERIRAKQASSDAIKDQELKEAETDFKKATIAYEAKIAQMTLDNVGIKERNLARAAQDKINIEIAKAKTNPIMMGFGALLVGAGLGVAAAGTAAAVSYSQGGEDPMPGKPSEATGDALEQIFGLSEENSQSIPAPEDGVSPFRTLINKLNKTYAKLQQLWIDEEAYKVQIKKLEEKYSEGSEETPPTETQEPATVE
ncbi:MAG: hypothetical protein KA436_09130 [Oligoflexales bacterium]|nr:hypothetical protein [Oligoflexales bacterium]